MAAPQLIGLSIFRGPASLRYTQTVAEREADDGGLEALLGGAVGPGEAVGFGEDPGPGGTDTEPARGRRWLMVVPIAAGAVLGFAALAYAVGGAAREPVPVVSEAARPSEEPRPASVTAPASGTAQFVGDSAYGVAPPQPSEPVTTTAPLPEQGTSGGTTTSGGDTTTSGGSTGSGTGSTTAPPASEPTSPSGGGGTTAPEPGPSPEPTPPPAEHTPPGQIDNPGNGSPPGQTKG